MIRTLCEVLEIPREEILGGSIRETRTARKRTKYGILLSVLCLLLALFFAFDGVGWLERRMQSGVVFVSASCDGELLPTARYAVHGETAGEDQQNARKFDVGYGSFHRNLAFEDRVIEFGFFNTNNWHNAQLRLEITHQGDAWTVKQTVSYATDGDRFAVTESTAVGSGKTLTVYQNTL